MLRQQSIGRRDDAARLRLARRTPFYRTSSSSESSRIITCNCSVGVKSGSWWPLPFAGFETLFSVAVLGAGQTTDDLGLNQTHGMIPHPERQIFLLYMIRLLELTSLSSLSSAEQ
jgi:hypothetical protein